MMSKKKTEKFDEPFSDDEFEMDETPYGPDSKIVEPTDDEPEYNDGTDETDEKVEEPELTVDKPNNLSEFAKSKKFQIIQFHDNAHDRYFIEDDKFLPTKVSEDLRNTFDIITVKDNKHDIFVYNDDTGLYEERGEQTLRTYIADILGDKWHEHRSAEVIKHITAKTYITRENFDVPIQFVPVENGILGIRKNPVEFLPFDKKFYFTNNLPIKYDVFATCPKFLKFLSEILPDEQTRLQIQEMFGWCLWREYSQQAWFLFVGSGSNGKGTLLNVLNCLLGTKNITHVPLKEFATNRFAGAELYHKFANVVADMAKFRIDDSSLLKQLCGNDQIKAERKFKNAFYFTNYAKLIFATNFVPQTKDKSDAFFRRLVIVFFEVKFGEENVPVDKHVLEKITTPEEMSGILNWALEGLYRLNKQGDFTNRMTTSETRDYYEKLLNPTHCYIDENVETDEADDKYIPKGLLLEKIEEYCEQNNLIKPTSFKQIKYVMDRYYPEIKQKQITVTDKNNSSSKKRIRVWQNCYFKENIDNNDIDEYVQGLFET